MPPAEPLLVARGVGRRFGYRRVLRDVSFEVAAGEALLIVGPNGAGKTTLLRILAGLLRPTPGAVERRAPLGFVAHDAMLYDALSARENLSFFARLQGVRDHGRIAEVLERMGLTGRQDDRVGTFSRGMVQRLSIARALLHRPRILLLDEPLSGLDQATERGLMRLLDELRRAGTAMVIVSHQLADLGAVVTHIGHVARGGVARFEALHGRDAARVAAEFRADD